jgi:hypothetical protein
MAEINLIEKSKTGEEFLKQIALGYRAAMRLRTRDYRSLIAAGQTEQAVEMIKHAVDSPDRFGSRITDFISTYGRTYLIECIAAYNVSTNEDAELLLQGIESDIATMQNYALDLVAQYKAGTLDYDGIAMKIEADIEYAPEKWVFPITRQTTVWDK